VARVLEVALDVHGRVGEVRLPLSARGLERALGPVGRVDDPHSLAAAAGRGLHDQRIADLFAEAHDLLGRRDGVRRPRDDRDARVSHQRARRGLAAHQLDRLRGRADPDEPGLVYRASEVRVLGEEAVPGVHGLRTGGAGGADQLVDDEIALGRGLPAERECLVRGRHVARPAVGVGVDGDRPQAELAERPEDADRDLSAVGHED
jgi:hypothetical protein